MNRLTMTNHHQPKIGFLSMFFDLYLAGGEALLNSCRSFAKDLVAMLGTRCDVVFPGVCINREDVDRAIHNFEVENVDLIVMVFLTYTPSMYALPALLQTKIPLVLFCTQKMPAVTEAISAWDTEENHGVHGFQDMASVLRRAGRAYQFISGYWKDESVQAELFEWCQVAQVRRALQHTNIGLLGYPMEHMGDFAVDETTFQSQMGIHVRHISMQEVANLAASAPIAEIEAQMQQDRQQFQVELMVTREQHAAASRLEWALRKTLQVKRLAGFASHFLAVGEEGWLESLPFLAASKLLGEGFSFGGEGDITSAAAVTILQMLAGEANFTEIFTIDFGGGTVLMSHMGEGNWKMARHDAPVLMRSDPFDMVKLRQNPVSLVFSLRPGIATLLNITTGPNGKIQWIINVGEVVDTPPLPNLTLVHYKYQPHMPVERFLTEYGRLGGSHHQALAYGDFTTVLLKLAQLMGIEAHVIT